MNERNQYKKNVLNTVIKEIHISFLSVFKITVCILWLVILNTNVDQQPILNLFFLGVKFKKNFRFL